MLLILEGKSHLAIDKQPAKLMPTSSPILTAELTKFLDIVIPRRRESSHNSKNRCLTSQAWQECMKFT